MIVSHIYPRLKGGGVLICVARKCSVGFRLSRQLHKYTSSLIPNTILVSGGTRIRIEPPEHRPLSVLGCSVGVVSIEAIAVVLNLNLNALTREVRDEPD